MSVRRITFCRSFTLSLSRTCRCYCKYCAFATSQPHLLTPEEVLRQLDYARRRRAKELLVLTGERPDTHRVISRLLGSYGHEDFTAYVVWACERALERGLLPHTNLGVLDRTDLARLRQVTASQGLMLESIRDDLVVHQGLPTKHPEARLATIRTAGALRIPFTTGILVGIGETQEDRIAALRAIGAVHREHGHIQEVILQNFVPHNRHYGCDPARIADQAQRSGAMPTIFPVPDWADPVTLDEMRALVLACRELVPGVGIQVPPNLSDWWTTLVQDGATDLGGLSANGDHISAERPFPSVQQMRKALAATGLALTERLCVYAEYLDPDWIDQGVLDVIKQRFWSFIPRRSSGRRTERVIRRDLVSGAIMKAIADRPLDPEELTALFAEDRAEVIEDMRQGADMLRRELAGEFVTFVVNRNINVS
ncbi:MAG: 7,8-didemethyl-8-hydroxy-5-deazariboflavin synthase subunit CofG, partial [Solirubrobacteraceae bacterium]